MSSDRLKKSYKKFCAVEGNQHIASEYAIRKLNQIIYKFNVNNVLEVGLGIGAVANSLLSEHKNLDYWGTEENAFCLRSLQNNLNSNFQRLKVFPTLSHLPQEKFDLIIIDGKDKGLEKISYLINKNGIICIEGDRLPQQKSLLNYFPKHRFVHSISLNKNGGYSPFPATHWQGGLKIIFIKPDIGQMLWWLKEKMQTKFKYVRRGYLK